MSVLTVGRLELLERHGRAYGELRLALAFTDGIFGDAAKMVTRRGWNQTPRLGTGDQGAAILAGHGLKRNPAVVLAASELIGIDVDGADDRERMRALAHARDIPNHELQVDLPATVTARTDSGWHF